MNVMLVSEPGVDGVFRYMEALAHYLFEQGVSVHLAYSDRRGSDRLDRLVEQVRIHGGATLNLATGNRPALSDLRALGALHRFARQVQPDVIHSHSSKAGVLARLLPPSGLRARHVYQPHAYAGMRPQAGGLALAYDAIERVLGRRGITINCSRDEQAFARDRLGVPGRRLIFIPNGVDTQHFRPATPTQKLALRHSLGLPTHGLVLGAMARTAPQKDPLTLYHAFAMALATQPDLLLYHVGHGELDPAVREFIRDHHLGDHVVRRDYLGTPVDFYRAIDGFILTSRYEGMSLAALEAMACDLPLILSDAPGNRGFLRLPLSHLQPAPAGDALAFAGAILRWAGLCHSHARASNHRAMAIKRFDHHATFGRVLNLYRHLACQPFREAQPRLAATLPHIG